MSALSIHPLVPLPNRKMSGNKGPSSLPRRVARAIRASPQTPSSGGSCALTTSVIASTMAEALEEIDEAIVAGADIVELRIDFLRDFIAARDVRVLLDACSVPCIVTYRPTWEGGQYKGDEQHRLSVLWTAVELGAAYVDCELRAAGHFFAAAPNGVRERSTTKIILSSHNYDDVPSEVELDEIHAQCVVAGADIVKIAAMVKDITQIARLENLLARAKSATGHKTIVLGMGEAGQVSRLLAAKFGS